MDERITAGRDENLLRYATERQAECLEAYWECGSMRKAAAKLGVNPRAIWNAINAVKGKAAASAYAPEHGLREPYADGFKLGKATIQRNGKTGEIERVWDRMCEDKERQAEMLLAAIQAHAEELQPIPARIIAPIDADPRLMACYPIGDLHVGMLSWPDETGEDWNLQIAEQVQCAAMAALVAQSPACEHATIINLGDWFHYDNMAGVTERSGHHLDRDGRYGKMAKIGVKIMRQCIESALDKHKTVRVINVGGNHDDTGAIMLRVCLANIYANEPRVIIDQTPGGFHYFRHGKVLVGCHHGHSCKPDQLPGVMAADRAQDWGASTNRYWWIGHVHHQSLKDYPGVTVESFRTLAAKDSYAHWGGYRAPRDMKCIVLDIEDGEVFRHTASIARIERLLREERERPA